MAEPSCRPLGCQRLGDGDSSRLLYTTTCRDVTCSAISRLASIFVRRSSQVFCRRNQSCGVVPKYLASRNAVSALTPRWLHVANEASPHTPSPSGDRRSPWPGVWAESEALPNRPRQLWPQPWRRVCHRRPSPSIGIRLKSGRSPHQRMGGSPSATQAFRRNRHPSSCCVPLGYLLQAPRSRSQGGSLVRCAVPSRSDLAAGPLP